MSVHEIMTEARLVATPETTIGELLPKMKELKIRVVPVVSNSKLVGVISYKGILLSGAGNLTKVRTVMEPPYSLIDAETLNDAIAKFVLWKAKAIPVVNSDKVLVGYVGRENILKYLLDRGLLPNKNVGDVMISPAIVIRRSESIARARWLMLRGGISRLPVIGDDLDIIEGVITMTDIVERLYTIRLTRRKGFEQFEEEFLAAPVKDFMSAPPITSVRSEYIVNAVEKMLRYRITGLPVTDSDRVIGVISGIDVLKVYAKSLVHRELIEAKLSETLTNDEFLRVQTETLLNEYLSDIRRITNIHNFKLNVKEESKGGRRRYLVRIRMSTDYGVMTAEGSGWDLLSSIRDALNTIEERIKKCGKRMKDLRRRDRSRGVFP